MGKVDCDFKQGQQSAGSRRLYSRGSKRLNSAAVPFVCPVASQTIDKVLEYKMNNELFLYEFEAVLMKMVNNGYLESELQYINDEMI